MDDWADRNPDLVRRIVLPAELKLEVRNKLDQANVTERVLFPGLDGLARALTRHYARVLTGRRARTGRPLPRPTSRQAIADLLTCLSRDRNEIVTLPPQPRS
jgi:hypothetical protein